MEQNRSDVDIRNDVLHSENHTRLTAEEIAKAVAHHNRHHPKGQTGNAPMKGDQRKKQVEKRKK